MKKVIFILFIFPLVLLGQNIDSLKLVLKTAKHDTTRCNVLMVLAEVASDEEWPVFNEQLKVLAEKNVAKEGNLKIFYVNHLIRSLNNSGYYACEQGNIPKALERYHQSLKIQEEIGNRVEMANTLNSLGTIYRNLGDKTKALEYYNKSLVIAEENADEEGVAYILNNIGIIYSEKNENPKALEFYQRSLVVYEKMNDKRGMANALDNVGTIYFDDQTAKALEYYKKSLKLREEIGEEEGIAYSLNFIARALIREGKLNDAFVSASRSMLMAKRLGYPENIRNAAGSLKMIFKRQNKHKEAFEMYELELKMRDSINNEVAQKASVKKHLQYAYEKKEAIDNAEHKKELEKQQALAEEKDRKQNIVIFSVVIGLILVIGFAGYVFKTLRITRKQKSLIETKSKEIEEKQREILDSIHYAKRIQTAQLPSYKYINKNLNRLQSKG